MPQGALYVGEVAQSLWCCVGAKTSVFNQDGFLENGWVHFSFLFFCDSLNILGGMRPLKVTHVWRISQERRLCCHIGRFRSLLSYLLKGQRMEGFEQVNLFEAQIPHFWRVCDYNSCLIELVWWWLLLTHVKFSNISWCLSRTWYVSCAAAVVVSCDRMR